MCSAAATLMQRMLADVHFRPPLLAFGHGSLGGAYTNSLALAIWSRSEVVGKITTMMMKIHLLFFDGGG